MAATPLLLLAQVPDPDASFKVVVVTPPPKQIVVAPVIATGAAITLNSAAHDMALLLHVNPFEMRMAVTVVLPAFGRSAEGMVNVPLLLPPMVSVAVCPGDITVFAPLRV